MGRRSMTASLHNNNSKTQWNTSRKLEFQTDVDELVPGDELQTHKPLSTLCRFLYSYGYEMKILPTNVTDTS